MNALTPTTGLMPPDSASGTTLHTIVAVMSFLACLTLGAVLTLSRMASEWTEGLSGSVTVQLLPSQQIGGEDQLSDALRITRAWPGIFSARPLSREEAMGLIEPWLGEVVLAGGWAHRLYRLDSRARKLAYVPLTTLDSDVALPPKLKQQKVTVRARLIEAGFTGNL